MTLCATCEEPGPVRMIPYYGWQPDVPICEACAKTHPGLADVELEWADLKPEQESA